MNEKTLSSMPQAQGLYNPVHEHDSCGVGFTANIDGTRKHAVIRNGIEILRNLMHRGAVGGDQSTGDGAGILFQIPDEFFEKVCPALGITLPKPGMYAPAMVFMPRDETVRKRCMDLVEKTVQDEALGFLGWRDVPVNLAAISGQALLKRPEVMQFFVDGKGLKGDAFERKLYVTRRMIEKAVDQITIDEGCFYISSLSCKTIVYKGLFTAPQLPDFYPDLSDTSMKSAVALVHQRYSTNTFPSWELAQPFRFLAHNG
jgi:glutamate synthase (NADPH/NADH) large chain